MSDSRKAPGFALIATLMLMVLLALLAIGMLSLSSISLRSAAHGSAKSEARANARMALMVAIGELQKQMGPDQRVSADGAILSKKDGTTVPENEMLHPHWTGVWNSWKASSVAVSPENPGGPSAHQTIQGVSDTGMAPTYLTNRSDYFRGWLLSLNPDEAVNIFKPLGLKADGTTNDIVLVGAVSPTSTDTAIRLVGEGSLGKAALAKDYVSARLLSVKSPIGSASSGRYAWWVGDESQKARIMDDSYSAAASLTSAEKIFRAQSPGSTGTTTVPGLEAMTALGDAQLAALSSIQSLDLVSGATGKPAENFHAVTPYSYQVLADVREGGLKRDLSTLLERPITTTETGDDFMLYRFNNEERVPIQDLAAYFQLYHKTIGDTAIGNKGVQYISAYIRPGIQITTPDFGTTAKFERQYTSLYRSPVPIKLQFMLGLQARERTLDEINADLNYPDTYELYFTISLSLTLWNPTNLPMVMDTRTSAKLFQRIRLWHLALGIEWNKEDKTGNVWTRSEALKKVWSPNAYQAIELDISRDAPLIFTPGEVKVLSIEYDPATIIDFDRTDTTNRVYQRLYEGWDPAGFMATGTAVAKLGQMPDKWNLPPHIKGLRILCTPPIAPVPDDPSTPDVDESRPGIPGDKIQLTINATGPPAPSDNSDPREGFDSRQPIHFGLMQESFEDVNATETKYYNYTLASQDSEAKSNMAFKKRFMERGFEGNAPFTVDVPQSITNGEIWPFMSFSLMAGTETSESANAGAGATGRKFASRPFIHSSAIRPSWMDADSPNAFYNYGWNWWIEPINSILEAPVQVSPELDPDTTKPDARRRHYGYYGGGYGAEYGSSYIVQQEIPVVPPMSLASLSHAHLGGYSLSSLEPTASWEDPTREPAALAIGRGGLFPHTLQAIGNSYAHPLLAANEAYETNLQRTFRFEKGPKTVVFADHSYLANKALWDEFFFSSITPQDPSEVKVFVGTARTAEEVAGAFFFGAPSKPLPNRRMVPHMGDLDAASLAGLFTEYNDFNNGLADKIAAHLMVEGPFNVNSTSVDAWKVLLSSLKGKPVAYLPIPLIKDVGNPKIGYLAPVETTPSGTPVGAFSMPNGIPVGGTSDPADPGQWTSPRELSDTEIGELATAIVKQVKLRGPFLSLSEFVNRRLDSSNPALAVKGALQAALDDPDYPPVALADADGKNGVSINAGFRTPEREFSAAEKATMTPAFPEALDGPVAYGSSAYVDQADILRNFSAQLTPRGDTFVIRTYGDSLDASGNVQARAWCEAVVQRIPEYIDGANEPQVKAADPGLTPANKTFGRKFQIVSFRWLSQTEV